MALTREKVELEIYKEDELFEESSDEEGDLLIKSAFEEEEEVGAKKLKVEEATEPKVTAKKLSEMQEPETLKEEVKEEVEDSKDDTFNTNSDTKDDILNTNSDTKDDIFNTSQNFMGSAPADKPLEERLKFEADEQADLMDACFTNIVKKEIKSEEHSMDPVPLMLPPGPEMTASSSSSSSPTWATIIPLIGGSALGCKEVGIKSWEGQSC